jgi:hypothetical protein
LTGGGRICTNRRVRAPLLRLGLLLTALFVLALPAVASAATFTVTRTPDSNISGCEPAFCTLRQAIEAANAAGAGSKVVVPAGTYTLAFGELLVKKPIAIEGAGSSQTIVDGAGAFRVFSFGAEAAPAQLSKLTVQNGHVTSKFGEPGGGGIRNFGSLTLESVTVRKNLVNPDEGSDELENGGGGILNKGSLTVLSSEIAENIVEPASAKAPRADNGSAIQNAGDLRIVDSAILRNQAAGIYPSGAIFTRRRAVGKPSTLELVRTRIEGNEAQAGVDSEVKGMANGVGVYASETNLTVRESTIAGNRGAGPKVNGAALYFGYEGDLAFESSTVANNVAKGSESASGGIVIAGDRPDSMRIVNSTVVGNEAAAPSAAGGVLHFGESNLEIASSTISGNRAVGAEAKGGNLYAFQLGAYATTVRDTIVSGGVANAGSENCFSNKPGVLVSAGHNIDSADQCGFTAAGDKVNVDPLLAPLSANGGPTATMALLAGSPAIDAGAGCPANDQRGVARPQGAACDIGAFEVVQSPPAGPPPPKVTTTSRAATLAFLAKKVKVGAKTGIGSIGASCGSDVGDRCIVELGLTIRLKAKKPAAGASAKPKKKRAVKVGSVSGTIAGGSTGRLAVKLNRRGLALLAAKGTAGFATLASGASRNASGAASAVQAKLKLKPLPKRKHGPRNAASKGRYTF